jgi:2'-5' RNA ligase
MLIRSFIALSVPREMANALGDAAAKMAYQDKSNAVRWVDQANYHITLAFLGEQEEQTLDQLAESLDASLPQAGLPIEVTHFSPFPESRPKLIAAMIANTPELKQVQQCAANAVQGCGISFERRKFIPHLTLGRFRHVRNHFAGTIPMSMRLSGEAEEVVLYESVLTPSGAEYDPIYRFPLAFSEYEFESG